MGDRLRADRLADGDPAGAVEADAARSLARIAGAPVVVVVCLTLADMDHYPDARRAQAEYLMAVQSVAMAVQNLLLAAHAEGLGACWMCAPLFCGDAVRGALDLPGRLGAAGPGDPGLARQRWQACRARAGGRAQPGAMNVVALAGGVGGAKLAHGLSLVLPPESLTVIVNTGDDFEHLGFHISPDVDTVMYTLAGLANAETGWGLAGETWSFLDALGRLGGDTWFRLGDRDLATHVERRQRLAAGQTLTEVTQAAVRRAGRARGRAADVR